MLKIYLENRSIILCDKDNTNYKNCVSVSSCEELSSLYTDFEKGLEDQIVFTYSDENMLKDWFFSMFTIVSAAGGLVQAESKSLFIFRRNVWDLPKGKIDDGETIEEAAVREVQEECGLSEVVIEKELLTTYHIYVFKGKTILKPTFWFLMKSSEETLTPEIEEDIEKAEWRTSDSIEDIKANTYPSILDVLSSAG